MTNPLFGEFPKTSSAIVLPVEDRFYARKKFFYDGDGNVKYMCTHTRSDALESDTSWECAKFTYTGSDVQQWQGWLKGSVESEASVNALAWEI